MALSIRNPKAEKLAKQIVAITGGKITQEIIKALEDRLERLRGRNTNINTVDEILKISKRCSSLPDLDNRPPEEILGYNENGVNK